MNYFLFGGAQHAVHGGCRDYQGVFPTVGAAKRFFAQHPTDWAHVATINRDGDLAVVDVWDVCFWREDYNRKPQVGGVT